MNTYGDLPIGCVFYIPDHVRTGDTHYKKVADDGVWVQLQVFGASMPIIMDSEREINPDAVMLSVPGTDAPELVFRYSRFSLPLVHRLKKGIYDVSPTLSHSLSKLQRTIGS